MNIKETFFILSSIAVLATACQEHEPENGMVMPAPQNIVCTNSSGTLTFSWDEVEGAEQYAARLVTADDDGLVELQYVTSATVTFSEDLESGVSYVCKVRAMAGMEYSEFVSSEPVVFQGGETPDPGTDPEPVEGAYEAMMIPAHEDEYLTDTPLAFPGAEGGGMYVTGGRGGEVLHVTSLADDGSSGTFRWAVEQSGPRIIVFDVAGRIDLREELVIRNGDLTIAGQTAPGDGICIAKNTVRVNADNIIIRFMRFRLGYDGSESDSDGEDTIWGRYHEDIILDHCSMSWSVDEVASFYANRNFTMQWCLLAEALRKSGHSKGGHGYGGIWGGRNASFHHNFLAHNDSRNARIDHPGIYIQEDRDYRTDYRGNVDYRNNVIYNYGSNSTYGGEDGHFNMVGNYYKSGPATTTNGNKIRKYFVDAYWYNADSKVGSAYPELYMEDNYNTDGIDDKYPEGIYYHDQSKYGTNPEGVVLEAPLPIRADDATLCHVTTHPSSAVFDPVVGYAGASLVRDDVDVRVADNAVKGNYSHEGSNGSTGGLIDSQNDVGGWPEYSQDTVNEANDKTDEDGDNIPDWFEALYGQGGNLEPDAKTIDIHGRYTDFEMYLHYLVRNVVAAQSASGTYTPLD